MRQQLEAEVLCGPISALERSLLQCSLDDDSEVGVRGVNGVGANEGFERSFEETAVVGGEGLSVGLTNQLQPPISIQPPTSKFPTMLLLG